MKTRLRPCSLRDADCFIKAHYLHKRPAVTVLCLGIEQLEGPIWAAVGVVVFALPPKQTSIRYGGLTWELARLYLIDAAPPNSESQALSLAVRHVRCHHREVRFLVSYADPSQGHKGSIYKAANWQADGRTDGERKTPRFDYQDASGKRYSRKGHVPDGIKVTRVPRISKFRFYLNLHQRNSHNLETLSTAP